VDGTTTAEKVHADLLEENSTSDYCTWYLRVLTGTQLKADPNRFLPYIEEGYVDINSFCQSHVEPMGKECTMVQVLALAEAFDIGVKIEYLDGHEITNNRLVQHRFGPENAKTSLTLIYRPGHYDILYPKET
jgi:ubiquitin thioesterase protein OTUB1